MIIRSIDGNIIGTLDNGVFLKRVSGAVHMLRTPPAWAIDCKAFVDYVLPQSHTIRIEDKNTGTAYEISTKVFDDKKVYMDRKFGAQYFVILKHWHEIRLGQKVLF